MDENREIFKLIDSHIKPRYSCMECKHYRWKLYDSGGEMGVTVYCKFRKDGKLECSLECFVPKDGGFLR